MRGGGRVVLDFEKAIRHGDPKHDVALMAGDELLIPPAPGMVQLEGEVYTPGLFKFVPGAFVRDYVEQAGGITESGNRDRIFLIEPTGAVAIIRLDDRDFFARG